MSKNNLRSESGQIMSRLMRELFILCRCHFPRVGPSGANPLSLASSLGQSCTNHHFLVPQLSFQLLLLSSKEFYKIGEKGESEYEYFWTSGSFYPINTESPLQVWSNGKAGSSKHVTRVHLCYPFVYLLHHLCCLLAWVRVSKTSAGIFIV